MCLLLLLRFVIFSINNQYSLFEILILTCGTFRFAFRDANKYRIRKDTYLIRYFKPLKLSGLFVSIY